MKTIHSNRLTLLALALLALSVRADVLAVAGPQGAFPTIQAAIDAAQDGDVVLVEAVVTAEDLVIDGKAITLTSGFLADPVITGSLVIENLAAGQVVAVARFRFDAGPTASPGLVVRNVAGAVRIMKSEFQGSDASGAPGDTDGHPGAQVANCADASFSKCHLLGGDGAGFANAIGGAGGPGCAASGSTVALQDCLVWGGDGRDGLATTNAGGAGAPAFRAPDGFLFIDGSHVFGGAGGDGGDDGVTCAAGGDGGAGLVLDGPLASADVQENWITPGAAGLASAACAGGAAGLDFATTNGATIVLVAGSTKSFRVASPVVAGQPSTVIARGAPGEQAFVYIGTDVAFEYPSPFLGPRLVRLPVLRRLAIGTIPAGGMLTTTLPAPPLPPGTNERVWYLQGLLVGAPGQPPTLADCQPWIQVDATFEP